MLKILTVFVVLIASLQFGFAQDALYGLNQYSKHKPADKMDKPVLYDYVQGSPYLTKNFIDGQIMLNIGKTLNVPVRYDIFADQIEYKDSDNKIYLVQNPKAIQLVIIDSLKFNYFEPGKFKNVKGFYELLVLGNYSLYRKYQILLKNPDAAGPGYHSSAAMFIPQDSKYYIMDTDANFIEIKRKKNLLLSGKDSDELVKFIKDHKIKTNKEIDLIRFVGFLNQ